MSWKKHFTPVNTQLSPISGAQSINQGPAKTNYSSYLPDVYTGSPNRIDRYVQYDTMDSDPEVNAALDILAEFCTQKLKDGKTPFSVLWRSSATNSEIRILGEYLQQWTKLQKFDTRIFRIMRNIFKYGDAFFIRDPETQEWSYIDPAKVVKIIVNESDGKKPEQYVIKDLAPNFVHLVATQITPNINTNQTLGGTSISGGYTGHGGQVRGSNGAYQLSSVGSRFGLSETEQAISAEHIVHLSLSEGLDNNYPFGNSLLENIFKVYKQKELLEDAILIYRIVRAPERLVFSVDVGNMNPVMAMTFVERVKNEIHQRRIPSQTGGGLNVIDSAYNPLCLDLETRIPLLDGRILTLSEIIQEFENGIKNWVFSCDPISGEVVPGMIDWAGVTRKQAKVIELMLDNGETVVCTPDHKIPVLGIGFVPANELTTNDRLISYKASKSKNEQVVWNDPTHVWQDLHTVINHFFKTNQTFRSSRHEIEEFKHDVISYIDNNENYIEILGASRIIDIKPVMVRDVGTITIDGKEKLHSYHTFAIASGIFVKNSINEDFFFPKTAEGRGSDVKRIEGGQNLGEIDDLKYFTNKLFRGLRIPSSYLPTGADDSQASYNDGRVGTAYIQELRFNKYCERLQALVTAVFDTEFKMYMYSRGINIDSNLFELKFNPPLNFASTRQSQLDSERINTFSTIQGIPFMSKRFALKRFLGLTDDEIAENERLWGEENGKGQPTITDAAGELRSAGLSAAGIEGDLGMMGDLDGPSDLENPEAEGEVSPLSTPGMAAPAAAQTPPVA